MTFRDRRTPHASSKTFRRIAVFRALQLGDLLCAVPALRALRAGYPDAKIHLIGLPWARDFVARFPHYLDGFIAFPGHPALPERVFDEAAVPDFLQATRAHEFDVAVQMHGDGRVVNALLPGFGAQRIAGFYPAHGVCPDPRLFMRYPDAGAELRQLLRLAVFLGGKACGESLEFPLHEADRRELSVVVPDLRPGSYVCLHAGSRSPSRQWRADQFSQVGDNLAAQGLTVILTGTQKERARLEAIGKAMQAPARNLAGKTSLGAIAALLKGARLLVCNDTGVSHLASALGVRSVVVFTGSDPHRWAPLDAARHTALRSPSVARVVAAARTHLEGRDHAA